MKFDSSICFDPRYNECCTVADCDALDAKLLAKSKKKMPRFGFMATFTKRRATLMFQEPHAELRRKEVECLVSVLSNWLQKPYSSWNRVAEPLPPGAKVTYFKG